MVAVLFVCLGNICRSPAGEAILRELAKKRGLELETASCGIGDWHVGDLSDARMVAAAKNRGFIISKRAEQFDPKFLNQYDYILASDHEVMEGLFYHARSLQHKNKIHLITAFSSTYKGEEVPDPYYEPLGAFDEVITILEDSCEGILDHLMKRSSS